MIICILFFEMNLATALWTGLIVGIAYTMFARAMYRQQLAVLQREMAREHQQHLNPRSVAGGSPRYVSVCRSWCCMQCIFVLLAVLHGIHI